MTEPKLTVPDVGRAKLLLSMSATERRLEAIANFNCANPQLGEEEWEIVAAHELLGEKMLNTTHKFMRARLDQLEKRYRTEAPAAAKTDGNEAIRWKCESLLAGMRMKFPQSSLTGSNSMWIVKPAGLSRGRGIHVLTSLRKVLELSRGRKFVVQKYIENPLLIHGRKVTFSTAPSISSTSDSGCW